MRGKKKGYPRCLFEKRRASFCLCLSKNNETKDNILFFVYNWFVICFIHVIIILLFLFWFLFLCFLNFCSWLIIYICVCVCVPPFLFFYSSALLVHLHIVILCLVLLFVCFSLSLLSSSCLWKYFPSLLSSSTTRFSLLVLLLMFTVFLFFVVFFLLLLLLLLPIFLPSSSWSSWLFCSKNSGFQKNTPQKQKRAHAKISVTPRNPFFIVVSGERAERAKNPKTPIQRVYAKRCHSWTPFGKGGAAQKPKNLKIHYVLKGIRHRPPKRPQNWPKNASKKKQTQKTSTPFFIAQNDLGSIFTLPWPAF